jgi:hypothetical protein
VLALGLGAARDESRTPRVIVPEGTESVRLDLDLEGVEVYSGFRAVLSTAGGDEVFSQSGLVSRGRGLSTVGVTVPGRLLRPGAYVLTLQGALRTGGWDTAALREFQVVSR